MGKYSSQKQWTFTNEGKMKSVGYGEGDLKTIEIKQETYVQLTMYIK